MPIAAENKKIVLSKLPKGLPTKDCLNVSSAKCEPKDIPLKDNEITLRMLYLSVDPYQRGRMRPVEKKSYVPAFELNEPIVGGGVAEVIASKNPKFKTGDVVCGLSLPFENFGAVHPDTAHIEKIADPKNPKDPVELLHGRPWYDNFSYEQFSRVNNLINNSRHAWYDCLRRSDQVVPHPKRRNVVRLGCMWRCRSARWLSSVKLAGLRVTGSAGSNDKIEFLKKELNFDAVVNYKTCGDLNKAIKEACPVCTLV